METIGFCSYKGGTGKTLAAANFAVFLSRLGKSCVLLDMDFDGPSLHSHFPEAEHAPGSGGFMRLFMSGVKGDPWLRGIAVDKSDDLTPYPWQFGSFDALNHYVQPLKAIDTQAKKSAGTIHFISATNIKHMETLSTIFSPFWRRTFTLGLERQNGLIDDTTLDRCLDYFEQIKKAIEKLDPSPEFFIIDFRSGYFESTLTLTSAWVDTLVVTFAFNDVSLDFTRDAIAKSNIMETEIVPVLCRIPAGIEVLGDRRLMDILERLGRKRIPIIHSDRETEIRDKIVMGYREPPKNSQLTKDYLELFSELLKTEDLPPEELRKRIGVPGGYWDQERTFSHEAERGTLINPSDGTRNVSFKVETFQLLLMGLKGGYKDIIAKVEKESINGAEESVGKNNKAAKPLIKQEWFIGLLRASGMRCGERFGQALEKDWSGIELSQDEKIKRWCEFDSDVGFGRFKMDMSTLFIKGGMLSELDIIMRESFLTACDDTVFNRSDGDEEQNHQFCSFMEGYIQGVLNNILENSVEVTHRPLESAGREPFFRYQDTKSESCVFQVKAIESENSG